jgi:hypothetical protein
VGITAKATFRNSAPAHVRSDDHPHSQEPLDDFGFLEQLPQQQDVSGGVMMPPCQMQNWNILDPVAYGDFLLDDVNQLHAAPEQYTFGG